MIREPERWSVTDLVQHLYRKLEDDDSLKGVWVEGEISNFSQHTHSRHMYFTLKDENATLNAVMFAGNNRRLRFVPKNGDRVLVKGYVSIYQKSGSLQLYAQDMRLSGVGDLHVAFQRLKEQLAAEGLFDAPKKAIPAFPKTVGVITSAHGAAVRDIISTMRRRYPLTRILLHPVSVQGEKAASEIAAAIDRMNLHLEADVLIVGRGGGSLEELWAFNEEIVARAIYRSQVPVISAVGHETDVTISDFAADVRAATPTAAAELVVPHVEDLKARVALLTQRLLRAQMAVLDRARERLEKSVDRPIFKYPHARLHQYVQRRDELEARLERAMVQLVREKRQSLANERVRLAAHHPQERIRQLRERVAVLERNQRQEMLQQLNGMRQKHLALVAQLDALSPLKVMQRGYSLVYRHANGELVKSRQQVRPGDLIRVRVADGQLKCQVWRSEENGDE
ncbi:Exodeoxyribonuclease VII large subunit [Laceyella tengchongensis]|uniref:Exodeoxyribonuclease 7 large subunit n=2 Tax=Laceyella tengchongensis TaxID=574699 RepID=A0AA46AGM9_9BACL|nr:Exodeoxyribonuclease VII large subunit [Laceyella tengchongensis]